MCSDKPSLNFEKAKSQSLMLSARSYSTLADLRSPAGPTPPQQQPTPKRSASHAVGHTASPHWGGVGLVHENCKVQFPGFGRRSSALRGGHGGRCALGEQAGAPRDRILTVGQTQITPVPASLSVPLPVPWQPRTANKKSTPWPRFLGFKILCNWAHVARVLLTVADAVRVQELEAEGQLRRDVQAVLLRQRLGLELEPPCSTRATARARAA